MMATIEVAREPTAAGERSCASCAGRALRSAPPRSGTPRRGQGCGGAGAGAGAAVLVQAEGCAPAPGGLSAPALARVAVAFRKAARMCG